MIVLFLSGLIAMIMIRTLRRDFQVRVLQSVLQCVAVCCSVLQRVAECVAACVAACCSVLQSVAEYCGALQAPRLVPMMMGANHDCSYV